MYRNFNHGRKKDVEPLSIEFWGVFKHAVKIWDHLNENWSSYQITKWFQYFWTAQYIPNDIKFFETPSKFVVDVFHCLHVFHKLFYSYKIIASLVNQLSIFIFFCFLWACTLKKSEYSYVKEQSWFWFTKFFDQFPIYWTFWVVVGLKNSRASNKANDRLKMIGCWNTYYVAYAT